MNFPATRCTISSSSQSRPPSCVFKHQYFPRARIDTAQPAALWHFGAKFGSLFSDEDELDWILIKTPTQAGHQPRKIPISGGTSRPQPHDTMFSAIIHRWHLNVTLYRVVTLSSKVASPLFKHIWSSIIHFLPPLSQLLPHPAGLHKKTSYPHGIPVVI